MSWHKLNILLFKERPLYIWMGKQDDDIIIQQLNIRDEKKRDLFTEKKKEEGSEYTYFSSVVYNLLVSS